MFGTWPEDTARTFHGAKIDSRAKIPHDFSVVVSVLTLAWPCMCEIKAPRCIARGSMHEVRARVNPLSPEPPQAFHLFLRLLCTSYWQGRRCWLFQSPTCLVQVSGKIPVRSFIRGNERSTNPYQMHVAFVNSVTLHFQNDAQFLYPVGIAVVASEFTPTVICQRVTERNIVFHE